MKRHVVVLALALALIGGTVCGNPAVADPLNNPITKKQVQVTGDLQRGMDKVLRGRAPPPAKLGTIGGKRICVPWC
jgi:hypothetical protein